MARLTAATRRLTGAMLTVAAALIVVYGLIAGDDGPSDRAAALAAGLRCPVCQSESVADSASQTARDMRALIDEMILGGRSDDEIEDFFISRYGEWILLDPDPGGRGLVLWALPAAGLAIGAVAIGTRLRSGRRR